MPPKGNQLTSWKEAYQVKTEEDGTKTVQCLYEDVGAGTGISVGYAKDDFLENIRFRITELTEMLEFCAKNEPRDQ